MSGDLLLQSIGTQSNAELPPGLTHSSSFDEKRGWFHNRFRPHFDRWVIGPIDRLVSSDDALVGFILMACAIDYLAGFWWGRSTERCVKDAYTGFIDRYFPRGKYDAGGLYDSLRNGLVHMFTIKGRKYTLVHNRPNLHLAQAPSGHIILNAADLRGDLLAAKEKYFDEVESEPGLMEKLLERYTRDGFLDYTGGSAVRSR